MGEIADYYVEQAMKDWKGQGSYSPPNHFNPYLTGDDYNTLIRFLTMTLRPDIRLSTINAKRFILDRLIKRGKLPHPTIRKLNNTEMASLLNIIKNAGMELDGYDDANLQHKVELEAEKEKLQMNNVSKSTGFQKDTSRAVPTAEVESLFRVESSDVDEGELSLVLERGIYREVVAVSFSYPHYRSRGFYAERKSTIFSKEPDTDKMVIDMNAVFHSLAILLNNLASADLLTEDVYNNAMDGFEPFIYEALDFSEIQSLIGKTSGLKDGKKKRIKARGTKGANLRNK